MKKNENDEAGELMKEWEESMSGFVPEDMITVFLKAKSEEVHWLFSKYVFRYSTKTFQLQRQL